MEKVGVEAVVEGLQAFLGDMRSVNSALNGLRPSGTLLEQMFTSVAEAAGNFGREVLNVVETALGMMLRDAIEGIIRALGDLINSIIETGSQFQLLKIRLTGLNLNDFADGTRSFADAMQMAGQKTQEEITWLQTLGAQTPFDPAQIADTYTQARAFGFTSDEAQRLTTDIINYTAAMGLSNETLFLVIQNLGQMVQRGKITGTEIRDLARGSFLPLNDVLERIAKNMGITVAELTKKISTPAGVPASEFVKAFEQMVEEEPRFIGAAGRLSRAFVPASQNVKELFTSIFGLNTTVPILDILGEKIAKVVDVFVAFNEQGDLVKTARWDALVKAATELGTAIGGVVTKLLDFLPSGESMADTLINAVQGVADWIAAHQTDIIDFFVGVATAIDTYVIQPFLRISGWVAENWPTITEFFTSLGDIITQVFGNLFGGEFAKGDFLGGLLNGLKAFMQFVSENKDQIADWITKIIKVIAVIEVLLTVFNVGVAIVGTVVGALVGLVGAVLSVIGIITALTNPILVLGTLLVGLVAGVIATAIAISVNWNSIKSVTGSLAAYVVNIINAMVSQVLQLVTNLGRSALNLFAQLGNNIRSIDWLGIGRSIITGIGQGVLNAAAWLSGIVRDAVMGAYYAALAALGISSPSKLFAEIGTNTMEGFAIGVQKYAGLAATAMTSAMQQVAAPAISVPSIVQSIAARNTGTSSVYNTSNFNLAIHSSAPHEPVMQDFAMMQSLAGV